MRGRRLGTNKFKNRFLALIKNPFFWTLTIVGNTIVVLGSILLYQFESTPENRLEFIDCLLWSTGTVTTVGFGNYVPVTIHGKLTILVLMIAGTLFIWSYMAFLVTGLMAPELSSLERDVHEVEKEIRELKGDVDEKIKAQATKEDSPYVKTTY